MPHICSRNTFAINLFIGNFAKTLRKNLFVESHPI